MQFLQDTWLILEAREEDISMPSLPDRISNLLLARKIEAAKRLVPCDRILLMLTDRSCAYVGKECASIPSQNILIHPSEWGNAVPTVVWLLETRRWNPRGRVLFVPSGSSSQSIPELCFALNVANHWLERDPAKVFLIQFPLQQDWNCFVYAPAWTLLLLYMNSAPELLKPFLDHPRERGEGTQSEPWISGSVLPSGDLFEQVLSPNPLFLERLPLASQVIPGPFQRAAMLEGAKGTMIYH